MKMKEAIEHPWINLNSTPLIEEMPDIESSNLEKEILSEIY